MNNLLLETIEIFANGTSAGTVPAQQTRQATIASPGTLTVSFRLVRSTTTSGTPVGDDMSGVYNPIPNAQGQENFQANNVIGGQYFMEPHFNSSIGSGVLLGVNMGLQAENRCDCTIPASTNNVVAGYYRLYSNSNIRLYRNGSGYSGPYVYWGSDPPNNTNGTFPFTAAQDTGRIDVNISQAP